jgi:protein involved in polysaccharide export with SLBB domain/capsular polysaccharide biosynthesis protein
MKSPYDTSSNGNGSLIRNSHNGNGNGNGKWRAPEKQDVDFLPFVEILLRHWPLLMMGGIAMGIIGVLTGAFFWHPNFTATAQLVAYESPNATEVFGQRQVSPQTIASVLKSPELFREIGARMDPPVAAADLTDHIEITPDRDSDTVNITAEGETPKEAVDLVNLYASQAVRFTQRLQQRSAEELDQFYATQLARIMKEISTLDKEAQSLPREVLTQVTAPQPNSLLEQLQKARVNLAQLLSKYTDMHPLVQAQRAEIAAIEMQLTPTLTAAENAEPGTNAVSMLPVTGEKDPEIIRGKLQAFEAARLVLLGKQQAVQSFEANPPGFCRTLAGATDKDVVPHPRHAKIALLGVLAFLLGIFGTGTLILVSEITDNRLKTPSDVTRITKLPVLAASGDLSRMSETARYNWAFRTWTKLQGQLGQPADHGLILGVTAANHGDGCAMWVQSLAQAASMLGLRVLTIVTREEEAPDGASGVHAKHHFSHGTSLALTPSILATPEAIAEQLQAIPPNSQAVVHIPLPGWVWNFEQRQQWQAALKQWAKIENVVIIIELPPASVPESVLLAENLPNVVWLTDCKESAAVQTREHLETFRNAHCNLAGAVLHRAPDSLIKNRFARWVSTIALLAGLFQTTAFSQQIPATADTTSNDALLQPAAPSDTSETPVNTSASLSASPIQPRAAWQQHLTLGPGDVVNFSLFGSPELGQLSVPIGPDGRVGYLEAQDVMAAGLTVDELRAKMDSQLAKYRRSPHTIITPVAFNSKKYFVLGSVSRGGVFTLDRPTTIVEAIARAKGMETVLRDRDLVEVADLQRSFLARRGQLIRIDFERLFQRGDLSQNVQLEPNDYLYLPATELKQVYVVGEVGTPGAELYKPGLSVVAVIAEAGGFTQRAWKGKVLVVRGSLNQPQTFAVNVKDILAGNATGFALAPGDIVYVHHRPWIYAEDLLNLAASAFIQSVVITWTGLHVGPFITSPIFPQ